MLISAVGAHGVPAMTKPYRTWMKTSGARPICRRWVQIRLATWTMTCCCIVARMPDALLSALEIHPVSTMTTRTRRNGFLAFVARPELLHRYADGSNGVAVAARRGRVGDLWTPFVQYLFWRRVAHDCRNGGVQFIIAWLHAKQGLAHVFDVPC